MSVLKNMNVSLSDPNVGKFLTFDMAWIKENIFLYKYSIKINKEIKLFLKTAFCLF